MASDGNGLGLRAQTGKPAILYELFPAILYELFFN